MTTLTAIAAASFVDSLGVNTHIDFNADGYQSLSTVEEAINYLGVENIRDSGQSSSDLSAWQQVAQATGAKFDDYIGETSPSGMQTDLGLAQQLAQEGILNYIEGGNEEDDSYPASLGNNLQITAQFQQQVYAMAHQYGLQAINMSFGSGWTAANNWEGDYPNVGNLSSIADYANAHTYPNSGQTTDAAIQQLNGDALLAAGSRQVITTEIGWNNNGSEAQQVVQAALDGIKDGDAKMYFYALFNDNSGNYGLMNSDGSPTAAGTALHDLTSLLADNGSNAGSFSPGSLDFSLSGQQSTDNTVLMQKSDGTYWVSLWDESAGAHTVTLNLASTASQILVFDPVTGTSSIASANNTNSISVNLGGDPLLIEVVPSGVTPGSDSSSTGATTGSTGSGGGSTTSITTTATGGAGTANDLAISAPASETVAAGSTQAISGVSASDAWAASAPGTMALNVWDQSGTLTIDGQTFGPGGSEVPNGMFTGSLAQINADLASLTYTAGASGGSDTITIDVWNQGGVEVRKTITVNSPGSSSSTSGGSGTSSSSSGTVTNTPGAAGTSQDLAVTVPAAENLAAGGTTPISGVSVSDPWAAAASGTMALNVWDQSGTLTIAGQSFGPGGGVVPNGMFVGSLAQINADLASLSYTAGANAGSDTITVDVWNQAGVEVRETIPVTATSGTSTTGTATPAGGDSTSTGSSGTTPGITIDPGNAAPVETVSNTTISATAGDHMIFIGGTGDTLTATGGTETVQAYQGGNTITTGDGDDTIRYAGSNNVVNAGAGNNTLFDSGTNNTIVLPGANQGYDDIYGYMMTNGDQFDLRTLLSSTQWNGDTSTIGNYLSVTQSGTSALVNVDPSGVAGGASYTAAKLEAAGAVSLSTLLAHSIT